jgi:hypothetical protein
LREEGSATNGTATTAAQTPSYTEADEKSNEKRSSLIIIENNSYVEIRDCELRCNINNITNNNKMI